jgi:ABC-type phosphate transport system auxiliary subunit
MPMSDEARAALATLRKIELEGDPTSWAITHRDEIAKAFDKLLTFMSEAERLQAENAALRQRLDNLASDIDRFYVDD